MNETIKNILLENLNARKEALENVDNLVDSVEVKKIAAEEAHAAYTKALTELNNLGELDAYKTNLAAEIAEIENAVFPKPEQAGSSEAE